MTTTTRLRGLARAVGFYAIRPRQLSDIPRWRADSRRSTIEARSPWWPYQAIEFVADALPAEADVFEYGAGGSTMWLRDQGASVTSIEHDAAWYADVRRPLGADTDVRLIEPDLEGALTSRVHPGVAFDAYVRAVASEPDGSFDLVIVDGRVRVACAKAAMPKVRPGGMLLLDDSDRKKYQEVHHVLAEWEPHHFQGLKPGGRGVCRTTVWVRPN